jgi:Spy/CpxP family protein refolding chaperone
MKLSLRSVLSFVTFATALSLVPAAAFAQEAPAAPVQGKHMRHHKGHKAGLVGAALKLDSITPEQRTQIEGLVQARKVAQVPVRQADAQVLTVLAQQVEAGKSDPQVLGPSLAVERAAAMGAARVDQATLVQLHSILTPAQRAQLVDRMEARTGKLAERKGEGVREHKAKGEGGFGRLGLTQEQKAQIKANLEASRPERPVRGEKGGMKAALESFRGDSFSAPAMEHAQNKGMREVRMTTAMIPVLTPNQRATVAAHLRARATREGKV